MTEELKQKGLPVPGYQDQSNLNVVRVSDNKRLEERVLRMLDHLRTDPAVDQRWLAIGRTQIEQGFMAVNRAIFKPTRVSLPEDAGNQQSPA